MKSQLVNCLLCLHTQCENHNTVDDYIENVSIETHKQRQLTVEHLRKD